LKPENFCDVIFDDVFKVAQFNDVTKITS